MKLYRFQSLHIYIRNDSFASISCKKKREKKKCIACMSCVYVVTNIYVCVYVHVCVLCVKGGTYVLCILYTNLAATYSGSKITRL